MAWFTRSSNIQLRIQQKWQLIPLYTRRLRYFYSETYCSSLFQFLYCKSMEDCTQIIFLKITILAAVMKVWLLIVPASVCGACSWSFLVN